MTDYLLKLTEAINTDNLANAVDILKTDMAIDILNEALFCACRNGKPRFVELFLKAGADVNYIIRLTNGVNNEIANPLMIACQYGVSDNYTQVVRILLEHGADVHFRNDMVLEEASWYGRYEIMELLLEAGADVHAGGDAALRGASHRGHIKVVKLLLESGADACALDDDALRWASLYGHLKIVKILIDYGADKTNLHTSSIKEMREYVPVNPRRVLVVGN